MDFTVYTDGATINNGRPGAASGIGVFWGDDSDDENLSEWFVGRQTSSRAELCAFYRALQQISGYNVAYYTIATDSTYVELAFNKGRTWEDNGWRSANGRIKNRDIIEPMLNLLDDLEERGYNIVLDKIPGHSGIYGNERADELARSAANKLTGRPQTLASLINRGPRN